MSENADKIQDTRFKAGKSGNPNGKPKGTRHRASQLAEQLIGDQASELVQKVISLALEGDTVALRLCLERLCPPRRDRAITVDLRPIESLQDITKASAEIVKFVVEGEITPEEGNSLATVLGHYQKSVEITEIAERITTLEKQAGIQ